MYLLCIYISKDDVGQTVASEMLIGNWGRSRKSSLPNSKVKQRCSSEEEPDETSTQLHMWGFLSELRPFVLKSYSLASPQLSGEKLLQMLLPQVCLAFPKEHILKPLFVQRDCSHPFSPNSGLYHNPKHHKSLNQSLMCSSELV